MMRLSFLRAAAAISAPVLLSGCGYFDSRAAHSAQYSMVGMTSYDLQACAGLPGSSKKLNDTTEVWQYDGSQPLPTLTGSTLIPVDSFIQMYQSALGGGGTTCRMIVRMDHDRVSEVHYTGNDDEYIGEDGICSIITRGCNRQREATMHSVGGIFGPVSAFHPPATPAQSTSATYSSQSGQYVPNLDGNPNKPVIRPAGQ